MAGSTTLTPQERSLRAKIAAHALHARRDPHDTTAAASAAFLRKFEDEVDPRRELLEEERSRRAEHAMRAYMTRLRFEQVKARRHRGAEGVNPDAA